MNTLRIERLEDGPITQSGYFVAVTKNGECVGTCLTDGSLSPKQCLQSVYNNRAIDRMESLENESIDRSLGY
jgi:hypothetical protein